MPREARILYDGGIYHVLNRGNNKIPLFINPDDYLEFKQTIARYRKRYGFQLFNYCLMNNHFHFLLQVEKGADLPCLMKGMCMAYASYFKKRYEHVGFLFQNRYKSIPIEKDVYLLECARYIERNPLTANLVDDLTQYPWSSFHYYAAGQDDSIVTPNPLYETFGKTRRKMMAHYSEYIIETRPYEIPELSP